MKIRTNTALVSSERGTFWAGIHVEHDGYAFPESVWDDIAFGVLTQWGIACRTLIQYEGETVIMDFMDGPYFINCARKGDQLMVELVNDGSQPAIDRSFACPANEFFDSYVLAFDDLNAAFIKLVAAGLDDSTEKEFVESCQSTRDFLASRKSQQ